MSFPTHCPWANDAETLKIIRKSHCSQLRFPSSNQESGPTATCHDPAAAAAANSLQSCPTLCDPRDGSPPGSPVPGILQARTLEWVAISFSNAWKQAVKVKSLSCVWPSATPWTAAHQAPPSMGFSRQEYWSGVPLPSPATILLTYKEMTANAVFSNYYFGCTESSLQHAGSIVVAWVLSWGCGILVSWPRVEPGPPALKVQCLNHWTTRDISVSILMSTGSLLWKYVPSHGLTSIIQDAECLLNTRPYVIC